MPLGEFFSCVWLVLLAFNLMNTFPYYIYCTSSSSTTTHSSSSQSLSFASALNFKTESESKGEGKNSAATAAISPHLCHHSISAAGLISSDCQQVYDAEQQARMRVTANINEGLGPPACQGRNEKNASCYHYLMRRDCEQPWLNDWSEIRLHHCYEHSVQEAVPGASQSLNDPYQCQKHVNELLELDSFVAKVICQFEQVLLRYDCLQRYSVNNCDDCRVSYRKWVCASLIPHWRQRLKIKPCRSICHTVEQNCPWFLPADKTPGYAAQYAGEPIFQCIDANIPEIGEQLQSSTYGSGCCYEYCKEQRNLELTPAITYHHNIDKSKFPYTRIVSCEIGCNESLSDLSSDNESHTARPCRSNSKTAAEDMHQTGTSQKNNNGPLKNLPISSCPTFKTESFSNENKAEYSGPASKCGYYFLFLWFMLYFSIFANVKLIDINLR